MDKMVRAKIIGKFRFGKIKASKTDTNSWYSAGESDWPSTGSKRPARSHPTRAVGDIQDAIGQPCRAAPEVGERELNHGARFITVSSVIPGIDLRLNQGREDAQVGCGEQVALALGQVPLRVIADAGATEVRLEHRRLDSCDEEPTPGLDMNDGPVEARLLDNPEIAKLQVADSSLDGKNLAATGLRIAGPRRFTLQGSASRVAA